MNKRIFGRIVVISALLFVGAGCAASTPTALLPPQEDRCQAQGVKAEQADKAAEPDMTPLGFDTHFSSKLGACLFYDEYRGKSTAFPNASWVVIARIVNTDTGVKIAEYVNVDGTLTSGMDFYALQDEKNQLFRQ